MKKKLLRTSLAILLCSTTLTLPDARSMMSGDAVSAAEQTVKSCSYNRASPGHNRDNNTASPHDHRTAHLMPEYRKRNSIKSHKDGFGNDWFTVCDDCDKQFEAINLSKAATLAQEKQAAVELELRKYEIQCRIEAEAKVKEAEAKVKAAEEALKAQKK